MKRTFMTRRITSCTFDDMSIRSILFFNIIPLLCHLLVDASLELYSFILEQSKFAERVESF